MSPGSLLRSGVKWASLAADRVVTPPEGVVVLIYHRAGGRSTGEVDLDPDVFDRHLAHLAAHHRVLSLGEAVARLRSGAPISGVVLTFDDGTSDFAEFAVPALVRHGLSATLYLATRFVDEQVEFPWGAPPVSWAALRDAISTGFVTVGSHTHSHWLLDRLDPVMVGEDLDRSIDLIGEHLGVVAEHFAYPKALTGSPEAEIAVRRRFESASLAASRVNRPGHSDLHRLWRAPLQRSDSDRHFAAKAAGGMRLEGEIRAQLAKLKYLGQRS